MGGGAVIAQQPWFDLPTLPPPSQYGNILINRNSEKNNMLPVTFSHWLHRVQYTCRVCHLELEFEMKTNATDITKEKLVKGQFCGACHNGDRAFGFEECERCHTGVISSEEKKFKKLLSGLPKTTFGNHIDWTKAINRGLIKPKDSVLNKNYSSLPFKRFLLLESDMWIIPPAIFPHEAHVSWLDCSNCHPEIFNIKKKTTEHFSMNSILKGEFCGICHSKVAFPLDDCKKCHPKIKIDVNK